MTKFSDLALDPRVLQAIAEAGYETPTPIQEQAIPEALKGRDVLGIAQTGTGKTASFTLPMITLLGQGRARARMPRSLVLAPTRELATQIGATDQAGVVDEVVEASPFGDGGFESGAHGGAVAHIGLKGERGCAVLRFDKCDGLLCTFDVKVHDRDAGTVGGEAQRDAAADSGACTGDQGNLVLMRT